MATIEVPERPSGPELAFIRKSYGVTQAQVAVRMGGVNRSRIAAIEAMARPPVSVSRRYLQAASEAFDHADAARRRVPQEHLKDWILGDGSFKATND